MESSGKKPWRKILYEEQDYPDNYVDKTQFLNGLKKNCKFIDMFACDITIRFIVMYYVSVHSDVWTTRSDPGLGSGHTRT